MTKREEAALEKKEFWQDHVKAWGESNLSQSEYCRKNNLGRDAFFYWKRKLSKGTSDVRLVPIALKVNVQPNQKPLVVVIDRRYRIEVSGDFEPGTLRKLVRTLEGI